VTPIRSDGFALLILLTGHGLLRPYQLPVELNRCMAR